MTNHHISDIKLQNVPIPGGGAVKSSHHGSDQTLDTWHCLTGGVADLPDLLDRFLFFFKYNKEIPRSSVPVICVLLGLTLLAMGPDLASSQKVIININGGWR